MVVTSELCSKYADSRVQDEDQSTPSIQALHRNPARKPKQQVFVFFFKNLQKFPKKHNFSGHLYAVLSLVYYLVLGSQVLST